MLFLRIPEVFLAGRIILEKINSIAHPSEHLVADEAVTVVRHTVVSRTSVKAKLHELITDLSLTSKQKGRLLMIGLIWRHGQVTFRP